MPRFIAVISPTSSELAENLNLLQRQSGLHEDKVSKQLEDGIVDDLNALTYQENILDTPLVITRASLYIYLNAMVSIYIAIPPHIID